MMWILFACGVGLFSWWLTDRLADKASMLGPIDHPNDRSLHHLPTPRTGGVAIVVSAFIGVVVWSTTAGWTDGESTGRLDRFPEVISILGGTLFLAIVSFLDDRKGLAVLIRFGCHLIAACGAVFGGGVIISSITVPGWGGFELGWAAAPMTLAFLLWMTNLYNFMDGMDGFAGGMTVVGFGLMGYFFWISHHPMMFGIAVIQAAAATGFLVHNFPPARIFMGDVGSISTGFLAGGLIVLGCREKVFDLWVPLVVFSPFIVDATVTLVRRALRHEKIWLAHREHYYQRFVLSGWSHRQTVLMEYGLMLLCGCLAILYQNLTDAWRLAILAIWSMIFVAGGTMVSRLEQRRNAEVVR